MHETPSNTTSGDVFAFQLHRLASTFGDKLSADRRKDVRSRDGLDAHFSHTSLANKFIDVAQAIATLLTPSKGHTNFALMLGFADKETHIFYCKNGAGKDNVIRAHLRAIWRLLQQILRPCPERKLEYTDEVGVKLRDMAYKFVSNKALDRASKRFASISRLIASCNTLDPFQDRLLTLMRVVSYNAAEAAKLRVNGVCTDPVFNSQAWRRFRSCTTLLNAHAAKRQANIGAIESLKEVADRLPNGLAFDFEKCLNKLIKVEAAVLTLYNLALSGRRGHVLENELNVHEVALPARQLITLSFSAFDTYLPIHPTSETIKAQMRVGVSSTEEDVTIISKVHSEVQLVAWVAQNLAPEVTLVPYITCSKLHCFACFVWLEEFNSLHDLTLPYVAFDGCHGGLQPGWLPPSLETVAMEQILGKMSSRLQDEFTFKSSEKPTTIIVPSKSMEDIFQSALAELPTICPRRN
ncbi:hypothetical protein B0H13DRAFT_1949609 [Mycena leptocephala]|nr:hypothetical protein B0H13DRAFT_1949609 [Mycena leptocephala]